MRRWSRHLGAAGIVAGAAALARLTRYEIADRSMEPVLRAGDWVIGIRRPAVVRPGEIVVFEHRPGLEMVKRVAGVAGDRISTPRGNRILAEGEVWVLGDNPAAGSVDSRAFGPIAPRDIRARLVARYHPRPFRRLDRSGTSSPSAPADPA
jgi:type IV secretory pathway protease TraF